MQRQRKHTTITIEELLGNGIFCVNASRDASRFCPLPQTPGVFLALFAGDTCLYATDSKKVLL
jgi:hypothetical protein